MRETSCICALLLAPSSPLQNTIDIYQHLKILVSLSGAFPTDVETASVLSVQYVLARDTFTHRTQDELTVGAPLSARAAYWLFKRIRL